MYVRTYVAADARARSREGRCRTIHLRTVFFWQLILPLISLLFVEMSQSDRRLRPRRKSLLKIGNISKLGSSHLPPVIDSAFILPREVLGSVHKVIAGLVTSCTGLTCARGPEGFIFFLFFFESTFMRSLFVKLQRVWCFFFSCRPICMKMIVSTNCKLICMKMIVVSPNCKL